MIADKQTHRQTDTLITILRFPIAVGAMTAMLPTLLEVEQNRRRADVSHWNLGALLRLRP